MLPALHLMAVTAITIIFYNNSLLRHSRLQHFLPLSAFLSYFYFYFFIFFFNPHLSTIFAFRGFPLLHNALPLRYNAQSLSSSHSPFSLSFGRDGGGGRCDSCYCGAKGLRAGAWVVAALNHGSYTTERFLSLCSILPRFSRLPSSLPSACVCRRRRREFCFKSAFQTLPLQPSPFL